MLKTKSKNEKGFIAIIALGIFMLIAVFSIIIQKTTTDTVNRVKDTNQYYEARDIADSTMEYLRWDLNKKEPGYNYKPETCVYGDFAAVAGNEAGGVPNADNQIQNKPVCDQILTAAGILQGDTANKDVKITMEIKGRNTENEKFTGNCSNTFSQQGCYTVPMPGTGNAGNNCELYNPTFPTDASATNTVNSKGQISAQAQGAEATIPQIDYSCNWNKLTFGSSVTDRVTIPLYYQNSGDPADIKNPYFNDPANLDKATKFVVRIRTPCLPCVYTQNDVVDGKNRICAQGQDEKICSDDKRYELDDEKDDIVVQWQISGICVETKIGADGNPVTHEEECGLVQNVDDDEALSSAITESLINDGDITNDGDQEYSTKEVLYHDAKALDTNTEENIPSKIKGTLSKMEKPVLTLFLGEKLISKENENIPYLEYQVLTDQPVANSSTVAEVTINVEGIVFKKTLYKEEQKPLIDFAVQN